VIPCYLNLKLKVLKLINYFFSTLFTLKKIMETPIVITEKAIDVPIAPKKEKKIYPRSVYKCSVCETQVYNKASHLSTKKHIKKMQPTTE